MPFLQFAKKYGDIFSLRLFGGQVVVINSYKRVREALVEKGENFVDRPNLPLFTECLGNKGSDTTYLVLIVLISPIKKPAETGLFMFLFFCFLSSHTNYVTPFKV